MSDLEGFRQSLQNSLQTGSAPATDKVAKKEAEAFASKSYDPELDLAREEIKGLKERNTDLGHYRKLRDDYAKKVFVYLVGYSVCVFLLLVASGTEYIPFSLPEQVLSLLVGSTAVSAIGLVLTVTIGLFPKPKAKD